MGSERRRAGQISGRAPWGQVTPAAAVAFSPCGEKADTERSESGMRGRPIPRRGTVTINGDGEGRAAFSVGRKLRSVTVPTENRAIQPDGESFQDEFKKLEVRMYEVE